MGIGVWPPPSSKENPDSMPDSQKSSPIKLLVLKKCSFFLFDFTYQNRESRSIVSPQVLCRFAIYPAAAALLEKKEEEERKARVQVSRRMSTRNFSVTFGVSIHKYNPQQLQLSQYPNYHQSPVPSPARQPPAAPRTSLRSVFFTPSSPSLPFPRRRGRFHERWHGSRESNEVIEHRGEDAVVGPCHR